jgi:hypothetical protein
VSNVPPQAPLGPNSVDWNLARSRRALRPVRTDGPFLTINVRVRVDAGGFAGPIVASEASTRLPSESPHERALIDVIALLDVWPSQERDGGDRTPRRAAGSRQGGCDADRTPAMIEMTQRYRRPRRRAGNRLAAFVKTRDGAQRLPGLLVQLQRFADEIVVAVDDGSIDDTLEVARGGADVVCRFCHGGEWNPVELLPLSMTRCDWILRIDDDDRVDAGLPGVLDDLLSDRRYTHWYLPQLTVKSLEPPLMLDGPPWHPCWVVRFYRADPTIVAMQRKVHEHLRVMGLGGFEARAAILHYEHLLYDRAGLEFKADRYESRGYSDRSRFAIDAPGVKLLPLPREPLAPGHARRRRRAPVIERVANLDAIPRLPGWGASIAVNMADRAVAKQALVAEVTLENTGSMSWWPVPSPVTAWPQLGLHFTIRREGARRAPRAGGGYPVPRIVAPGEQVRLLCPFEAPATPGEYVLDWDMASHNECWFAEVGSPTTLTRLLVVAELKRGVCDDLWSSPAEERH